MIFPLEIPFVFVSSSSSSHESLLRIREFFRHRSHTRSTDTKKTEGHAAAAHADQGEDDPDVEQVTGGGHEEVLVGSGSTWFHALARKVVTGDDGTVGTPSDYRGGDEPDWATDQ